MKLSLIISMIQFVIGYGSPVPLSNDTLYKQDPSKNEITDKVITITVSYAAIACGCAHWFETKYKKIPFLDGVERFYLEPTDSSLLIANKLWDGVHLPLTLKVTGRFSKEKRLPPTLGIKDEPEKARIFWYDRITVVSPAS